MYQNLNEATLDQQELNELGYGKDSVRAKAIDGILANADRVEYKTTKFWRTTKTLLLK